MTQQIFVEKVDGKRQSINAMQCEALKRHHGYSVYINTPTMQVLKNLSLKPKRVERLRYGGGHRMKQPFAHLM